MGSFCLGLFLLIDEMNLETTTINPRRRGFFEGLCFVKNFLHSFPILLLDGKESKNRATL